MAYGSAGDLPTVKEMRQQLTGLRLLGFLVSREQRAELKALSKRLRYTTRTVDAFYDLLGPRHWVFHEDLSLDDMAALVARHSSSPEAAEQAFIAWYGEDEHLAHAVRRLNGLPAMRARAHLLASALVDHEAGRFYAVVQVLLSVMDGFVNDLDPAKRRGLHAREPDELDAWNSVVGHHQGLSAAHESFTKSFKARNDEPVYELYRHGIVHGMLTNYDNPVVATKAWNRLFAVADWARSLEAEKKEAEKPPDPTWKEMFQRLQANEEVKAALAAFTPTTLTQSDQGAFAAHPVYVAMEAYLTAWKKKNYGHMAEVVTRMFGTTGPGAVRADYQGFTLEEYDITSLHHVGSAVCTVRLDVVVNGAAHSPQLRWIREGVDGQTAMPNRDGEWRLMWWGVAHMTRDAEPDDESDSDPVTRITSPRPGRAGSPGKE